jgi:transcriptional regulator with XRE-family HTH domain
LIICVVIYIQQAASRKRRRKQMASQLTFGEFFKTKRIELGKTLREFCKLHGLDAGNISKIERGLLSPPEAKEKLDQYCEFLEIKKGSRDWFDFFDLAASARGSIPADLRNDQRVLDALPIIFRTFRDKKISATKIDELIEAIKKV